MTVQPVALPPDLIPAALDDAPLDLDVELADTEWPEAALATSNAVERHRTRLRLDPMAWRISDLGQAEWAMRLLAEVQATRRDVELRANLWRSRIDQWETEQLAGTADRLAWLDAQLQEWGLAERARSGVKSPRVPSGVVETRGATAPSIVIADQGEVLAWAKQSRPEIVKVEESVLVSALREVAKVTTWADETGEEHDRAVDAETGEAIPGAAVEAPTVAAKVKPS